MTRRAARLNLALFAPMLGLLSIDRYASLAIRDGRLYTGGTSSGTPWRAALPGCGDRRVDLGGRDGVLLSGVHADRSGRPGLRAEYAGKQARCLLLPCRDGRTALAARVVNAGADSRLRLRRFSDGLEGPGHLECWNGSGFAVRYGRGGPATGRPRHFWNEKGTSLIVWCRASRQYQ